MVWFDLLCAVSLAVASPHQVEPDDPLLTLRLSNRYTAMLTSKQLRENAGLGKFPVKASKMKGARGEERRNLQSCHALVWQWAYIYAIV